MSKNIRSFKNMTPTIDESSYIDEAACVIGDVVIGEDCSVWPMVAIRGDVNIIRIGDRTNIQDGSVLHVTHKGPLSPEGKCAAYWLRCDYWARCGDSCMHHW